MKQSEWRDVRQKIYESLESGFLVGISPTESLEALREAGDLAARLRQQADDIAQEVDSLDHHIRAWIAENLVDTNEPPSDELDNAPLNDPTQYDAPLFDLSEDENQ
jgi:hypothetical protein